MMSEPYIRDGVLKLGLLFELACAVLLATGPVSFAQQSALLPVKLSLRPELVELLTEENKNFVQEYRDSYENVTHLYRNIKFVARRTKHDVQAQMKGTDYKSVVHRLTYRSNGGNFLRMDVENIPDAEETTNAATVHLVRPEGYIVAKRTKDADKFAIVKVIPSFTDGEDRISTYLFQWGPHSLHVQPLHRFFFSDFFFFRNGTVLRVTDVEVLTAGDEELVSFAVEARAEITWRGRFVFDRAGGWVLREYSWGPSDPSAHASSFTKCATFEYDGADDGVAMLKKAKYWFVDSEQHELLEAEYEIESVMPGPVPLAEFSPAALGFQGLGQQRSNWTWRILGLLIGVTLIGIYFRLRRQS